MYKFFCNIKKAAPLFIVLFAVFLLGGGLDFINAIIRGKEGAYSLVNAKITGLSPLVMLMYILGLLGVLLLYWGAKDLKKYPDNSKVVEQSKKRLTVAIFLVGLSFFAVELMYHVGYAI